MAILGMSAVRPRLALPCLASMCCPNLRPADVLGEAPANLTLAVISQMMWITEPPTTATNRWIKFVPYLLIDQLASVWSLTWFSLLQTKLPSEPTTIGLDWKYVLLPGRLSCPAMVSQWGFWRCRIKLKITRYLICWLVTSVSRVWYNEPQRFILSKVIDLITVFYHGEYPKDIEI